MRKKILIFGSVPPPVGGVRIFVEKLAQYFQSLDHYVDLFPSKVKKLKYDVAYINFSSPLKKFSAALIAIFLCKKCYLICHSSKFRVDNPFNFITIFLCTGVITTSNEVKCEIKKKFKRKRVCLQKGLLYREFVDGDLMISRDPEIKGRRKKILFYQNTNDYISGTSVYGADLMRDALKYLKSDISVVWIDLSGELEAAVKNEENVQTYSSVAIDLDLLYREIDLLVRPTAFDGTAFMVVEALSRGIKVLCSDVVRRPEGVTTFSMSNGKDFANMISDVLAKETARKIRYQPDSIKEFLDFTFH